MKSRQGRGVARVIGAHSNIVLATNLGQKDFQATKSIWQIVFFRFCLLFKMRRRCNCTLLFQTPASSDVFQTQDLERPIPIFCWRPICKFCILYFSNSVIRCISQICDLYFYLLCVWDLRRRAPWWRSIPILYWRPIPAKKDLPYHNHISSSCVPASEESDELLRPAHYHHIITTSSSYNDHVIIMLSYHHIIIWGVWFSEVIDQPLIMITSSSNYHNIIISSYHRHHIFIWGSARRWGLMKFSDCFSPPSTSLLAFNEKTTTNWTEYFCIFVILYFPIYLFL